MAKGVLNAVQCPVCLVGEHHPNNPDWLLIKVRVVEDDGRWFSHCLVCAGMWNKDLKLSPSTYDGRKGWFRC